MKIIITTLCLFFLFISIHSQPKWNVQLISPGRYEVTVVPSDTIIKVKFRVTLTSNAGNINIDKTFTNSQYPQLDPNVMYIKPYKCDTDVTEVSGTFLTYQPKYELPSGYNFQIIIPPVPPSEDIKEIGNKIFLEEETDQKTIYFLEVLPLLISSCPNVQPNYKDLEDWLLENDLNRIILEVTIIHQPTADGIDYYTAWGKSFFEIGSGIEGACLLTADPDVYFLYSDRYYTVPGDPNNLSQRFSFNNGDIKSITLDMARNAIICRSGLTNQEDIFSNVIRIGNLIYGLNNKEMIILNLYKSK